MVGSASPTGTLAGMPTPEQLTGRRLLVAQAAVRVIADRGMRGLTHRAVDTEAGLPLGSSSVLARTRAALLILTSRYVATRLTSDVEGLVDRLVEHEQVVGQDTDWVQAQVTELVRGWLADPALMWARAELVLEAHRSPELGELMGRSRATLLEVVTRCIPRAHHHSDAATRAAAISAALEGVLVAALSRPASDRDAFVTRTVGLLVAGLAGGE